MKRWKGLKALIHDAVDATTDLVGTGQDSVHRGLQRVVERSGPAARPLRGTHEGVALASRGVRASVKAVNRVVEVLSDAVVDASFTPEPDTPLVPLRSDVIQTPAWMADAAVAALNGVVGDHLARTANPLDLGLSLRHEDRLLARGESLGAGRFVVLVHGLGTSEWCWSLDAEKQFGDPSASFATRIHEQRGLTPVFARYNTGRTIDQNGTALAEALEDALAEADEIVLLGHSMGGLVSRTACHRAQQLEHQWAGALSRVISLGTPHRGAPLARLGKSVTDGLGTVDLPATQVLARLLTARSAGIRDLEQGELLGRDPDALAPPDERVVPLLDGVRYAFIATTLTPDPDHPLGRAAGDLLVQSSSAQGPLQHDVFDVHAETLGGVVHHRIQTDPAVLERLLDWLDGRARAPIR